MKITQLEKSMSVIMEKIADGNLYFIKREFFRKKNDPRGEAGTHIRFTSRFVDDIKMNEIRNYIDDPNMMLIEYEE